MEIYCFGVVELVEIAVTLFVHMYQGEGGVGEVAFFTDGQCLQESLHAFVDINVV